MQLHSLASIAVVLYSFSSLASAADISTAGIIESRSGGFMFPDGSIQSSAINITTGSGLVGGPITGSGTISIKPQGVVSSHLSSDSVDSSKIVNGSITTDDTDSTSVQARVSGTCAAGSAIASISQTGQVTCATIPTAPQMGKIAYVAKSGGNYASINDALNNASTGDTWCGTASASNPCTVKVMPGVYDSANQVAVLDSPISIEGSGMGQTIIRSPYLSEFDGMIFVESGGAGLKISNLSLEWTGTTTTTFPLAMIWDEGGAVYENMELIIGGTPANLKAMTFSSPLSKAYLNNIHFRVTGSALPISVWSFIDGKNSDMEIDGLTAKGSIESSSGGDITLLNNQSGNWKLSNLAIDMNFTADNGGINAIVSSYVVSTPNLTLLNSTIQLQGTVASPGGTVPYTLGINTLGSKNQIDHVQLALNSTDCAGIYTSTTFGDIPELTTLSHSTISCNSASGTAIYASNTPVQVSFTSLDAAAPMINLGGAVVCGFVLDGNLAALNSTCQ